MRHCRSMISTKHTQFMSRINIITAFVFVALTPLIAQPFQTNRAVQSTEISLGIPSPPILVAPSDHATAVRINPTFAWRPSTGALSYRLQVSTDSTFANAFIDRPAITDTTQHLIGLSHKTIYYWRVNATGADGTSPFSAAYRFRSHVIPGDFNGSGEIQAVFAYFILSHVANISILSGDALETADVSGDGTVSAYDAAFVLQVASGLLGVFPVDQ
jgi:hypothetical protein